MKSQKKTSLAEAVSHMKSSRQTKPVVTAPSPHKPSRRQILFRAPKEAHKQLKMMAVEGEKEMQSLLIEAINDLFIKYKKPPIG